MTHLILITVRGPGSSYHHTAGRVSTCGYRGHIQSITDPLDGADPCGVHVFLVKPRATCIRSQTSSWRGWSSPMETEVPSQDSCFDRGRVLSEEGDTCRQCQKFLQEEFWVHFNTWASGQLCTQSVNRASTDPSLWWRLFSSISPRPSRKVGQMGEKVSQGLLTAVFQNCHQSRHIMPEPVGIRAGAHSAEVEQNRQEEERSVCVGGGCGGRPGAGRSNRQRTECWWNNGLCWNWHGFFSFLSFCNHNL